MSDIKSYELQHLNELIDGVFRRIGISVTFTKHFIDRINDDRNGEPITIEELAHLFAKEYKQWGREIIALGDRAQAVMTDLGSDINIPFALERDPRTRRWVLIAKTAMRKPDFKTVDRKFEVESVQEAALSEDALDTRVDVPGIGSYTLAALKTRIEDELQQLADLSKSTDPYALRKILDVFEQGVTKNKVTALVAAYNKLAQDPEYTKEFGEEKSPYNTRNIRRSYDNFKVNEAGASRATRMLIHVLKELDSRIQTNPDAKNYIQSFAYDVLREINIPELNVREFVDMYHQWKKTGEISNDYMMENIKVLRKAK